MALLPHISDSFIKEALNQLKLIQMAIEGSNAFAHPINLTSSEILHLKAVHNRLLYAVTVAGHYTIEEFANNYLLDADVAQIIFEGMAEQPKPRNSPNGQFLTKKVCGCGICVNCSLP